MGQADKMNGGCLCGAVRFTATPEDAHFGACHCAMCRRWTAGPFLSVGCGSSVEVEGTSSVGVYKSSEWAERHFCSKCGSTLWYKLVGPSLHFVSVEAFDGPASFEFSHQIYIDEKPSYYSFSNETKNMTGAEVEATFASSDDGGNNG